MQPDTASRDYERIAEAIRYIEDNHRDQPDLQAIADHLGLSAYHFQRLFTRWAGISPKQFLQVLTLEHTKRLLADSESVLEASLAAGLSGPSRLHDLYVTCEAITPGQYKTRGEGVTLGYGFHPTPFGEALLALSARGVTALQFVEHGDRGAALDDLQQSWPRADLREETAETGAMMAQIFGEVQQPTAPLRVWLSGTNFQIQVWRALLALPAGQVATYGQIAAHIGKPNASRAVGAANGRNAISYLIPCHRVIRASGSIGGYRWGTVRKRAILAWEAAAQLGS